MRDSSDLDWVKQKLDKHGPGEKVLHAVPCKDSEGEKGWLVGTDQRVWYFQKGAIAAVEEYEYSVSVSSRRAPFGLDRAMLCLDGQPFEMPIAVAEEFAVLLRQRGDADKGVAR